MSAAAARQRQERPRKAGSKGPHWVILVIAVVGSLQLLYLNYVEADRLFVHRRDIAKLEADVAEMTAERDELLEVAEHGSDDVFREQLARKQGFIFPDELRVVTQRR